MERIFDVKTSKNEKVIGFYNKAMKELSEFYEINWIDHMPKIFLVPDRKTFNELYNKETESWVVGSTMNSSDTFYVLAPESYEEESNHKYSDGEYFRLIKHELSHLFSRILFNGYNPKWFTEGIAIYSSGQLAVKRIPKKFNSFLDFHNKAGAGIYAESGFAIEILIKKIGKKKFLKMLKDIKPPVTRKYFKEYFKKNFDIDLTYKWFNKNL
ncbi:MAG: hypothetical protein PHE21_03490 [Candidatus Dojkabacteria bacterium]|nr:hypothetical protein [Candidatus Dojkabacteria bacterium]